VCEVEPADDRMQAFLWRHLVPAQQFLAMVRGRGGRQPALSLETAEPLHLVPGSTADARGVAEGGTLPRRLRLELSDPPPGLSLASFGWLPDGLVVTVQADSPAEPGTAGNLIVEAWIEPPPADDNKPRRPWLAGILPPIPFEVHSP